MAQSRITQQSPKELLIHTGIETQGDRRDVIASLSLSSRCVPGYYQPRLSALHCRKMTSFVASGRFFGERHGDAEKTLLLPSLMELTKTIRRDETGREHQSTMFAPSGI